MKELYKKSKQDLHELKDILMNSNEVEINHASLRHFNRDGKLYEVCDVLIDGQATKFTKKLIDFFCDNGILELL